jgi:hypothetical protein
MKRKIAIAICLCCASYGARAQAVVNDPMHMFSNLMEFIESIDASIQSVEGVERVWNAGKQTSEHLKELKATVTAINRMLYDVQEVEYAIRDLADMGDMVAQMLKLMKNAGSSFSLSEHTLAANAFASTLTRATNNLVTMTSYFREDKWKMTDEERQKSIFGMQEKIAKEKAALQAAADALRERQNAYLRRKLIEDTYGASKVSAISPADLLAVLDASNGGMGEESLLTSVAVASLSIFGDESSVRKKETEAVATQKVKGVSKDFFTLYYCICAIVGLIGAYKAYNKVQHGEEFGKTVGVWLGSALTAYFLGLLVETFFFQ